MKKGRKRRWRRRIALVLFLAVFLNCIPLEYGTMQDFSGVLMRGWISLVKSVAAAAGETAGDAGSAASGGSQAYGGITPDKTVPSYESYKGMGTWKDRSSHDSPENTYSFTVASGTTAGSNVLYFLIWYQDVDGKNQKARLFPNTDAADRSAAFLKHYAGDSDSVNSSYGKRLLSGAHYKETAGEVQPLSSWTLQDFIFQTEKEIGKVERIDVYLANKGSYSMQGASVYRVTKFKGYEEYGLVSGQTFLDFEGYMVADLKKKGSGIVKIMHVSGMPDTMRTIAAADGSSSYFEITQYKKDEQKKSFAAEDSLYTMRMDFADNTGAGVDAFLNEKKTKLSEDNGIVEDMTAELQYIDKHGWTRKVTLPVLLSSFLTARKQRGDEKLIGFAGAGDTIAFPGWYPEYDHMAGAQDKIKLSAYKKGAPVVAVAETDASRFLVTLKTSTADGSGTKDDVSMRLRYNTTGNSVGKTPYKKVRNEAQDFLGPWPKRDGSDYVYGNGMKEGGSIS